jgi:RNA polymerase sigma factor (sigma-70 family)
VTHSREGGATEAQRFRELASAYSSGMRRLCAVYARNPADREDLFQDIFLAIWKALPAFRGDASERTWLYRIAHNVALTWRGKDRRSSIRRSTLEEAGTVASAPVNLRRILLFEMISRLPAVDRQLVSLWLEGFSMSEIEDVTGMRAGTVAVRLTRIRREIADAVKAPEACNG